MSSHAWTVLVYAMLALIGVGLEVASRRSGSAIPSLGAVARRVMRTRPGRVGVIAGWAWLGLHFFAR